MPPGSTPLASTEGLEHSRRIAPAWLDQPFRSYAVVAAAWPAPSSSRLGLVPSLDITAPLMPFVPAILLGAWIGGLGPGLFATVLGTLVGGYLFLTPGPSLDNVEPHELLVSPSSWHRGP